MSRRHPSAGSGDPIARAARSIALRVGATTAVVVLVAIVAAGLIFDRQQLSEISSRVETAAASADDVGDSPPGIWLVEVTATGTRSTPGAPAPVVAEAEKVATQAAARAAGTQQRTTIAAQGRSWPAALVVRGDRAYVAVYDVRLHRDEEGRLIAATAVAGALGVLLAAVTGLFAGRRAVRPLAEALALQRQFVADASHELRTPLAVISTRAQMVRRHLGPDADPTSRAEVDQLVSDTRAMADVVSDLLLSAQLEGATAATESVDLAGVADDVVTSLRPYAADAGVTLVPPSVTDGLVVVGVATGLRRAVLALVDNAIAHSPSGASVEVVVSRTGLSGAGAGASLDLGVPEPAPVEVRVEVVDHGSGVDPADVERLSRRFARARDDGAARRVGLGLALVTQVVQAHGGRLEVTETAGGGATFAVVVPG